MSVFSIARLHSAGLHLALQDSLAMSISMSPALINLAWSHLQQAKQLDPEFGMDGGDEDGWEDALGYLDACGPGVHLQIGRLSSDKRSNSLRSIGSGGMGVLFDDSLRDKVGYHPCLPVLTSMLVWQSAHSRN